LPHRVSRQGPLQVASPCVADWEQMSGNDRIRHCPQCDQSVYNLSAMTVREAAHLVSTHQGRLCVRYYRRADGTMLARDCPRGSRTAVRRASRIAGAALSAAMTVTFAAAQTTPHESQSLVQIDRNESGIVAQVVDAGSAVVPNAQVILINRSTRKEFKGDTDSLGGLRLLHLPAGTYEVSVSSQGSELHRDVVAIREQEITTLNVTLPVGGGQTVIGEVAGGQPMPLVVVDSVAIPLEPASIEQDAIPKKPLLKRMFSGAWHKLGF
jgi:Carboxypeptidase regulatory-like domain